MERYNIYHRRDGRYEGRISRGKRQNGKRNFQYFFGKTKDEVKEKMAKVRRLEKENSKCSKTVTEVYEEFYRSIKHRIKESTVAYYQMKAFKHIIPAFGKKRIDAVSEMDIYAFMETKQNEGLSNRYIIDIIILMKTIFKYAVKVYRIFNPMDNITLPKKKNSEIAILDTKQQCKLNQYITQTPNRTTLGVALSIDRKSVV